MDVFEKKFVESDVEVKIKHNEAAYFYALKDNEPIYLALKILVRKNNEIIAEYFKEYKEEISTLHYYNFVKNFLENPESRLGIAIKGEWEGVIGYISVSGINIECEKAISRLNKKNEKKLKFKDFTALKTYGSDKFSRMKKEKLTEYVTEKQLQTVRENIDTEKDQDLLEKGRVRSDKMYKASMDNEKIYELVGKILVDKLYGYFNDKNRP